MNGHVEYKTNPPTSGNHFEIPSEDGAYFESPPMEHLVHSLEHGRVILWFQPNAAAQLKGQMKALFDEDDYHMLLAPNTRKMPVAGRRVGRGRGRSPARRSTTRRGTRCDCSATATATRVPSRSPSSQSSLQTSRLQ